jgi:hypothetical protein
MSNIGNFAIATVMKIRRQVQEEMLPKLSAAPVIVLFVSTYIYGK